MKVLRVVWDWVKRELKILVGFGHHEVDVILHLPFIERVTHKKARRSIICCIIGIGVMSAGSSISVYAHELSHVFHLSHVAIDTFAYGLHGLGLFPIARHIDLIWLIFLGGDD